MHYSIPTLFEADLVVVGGGPAGICAAVAAARAGAGVAIIERWPILGGQSTMARVNIWHTSDKTREVILGLTKEFIERLEAYDAIERYPNFPRAHETYKFDPEWATVVYDDLARELGIRVLCSTPCVAALVRERRVEAVIIGTKKGLRAVRAPLFVDASGDADLAFFAGCQTHVGRERDGKVQGMTLVCRFSGLDPSQRDRIIAAEAELKERMAELRDRGELPPFGPHGFGGDFTFRWNTSLIACTSGDPLDEEDLTRATMEARAKIVRFLRFFRAHLPGGERLKVEWMAPALGVRESRRVQGLYTFTGEDIRARRSFPDAVGHGFWMVDIHDPEGSGHTTWYDRSHHLEPGTTYQIPYRILIARDVENLFMAGRCASATHEGMAGLRIQSHCHVMGQAAGTAAAMCLEENIRPAEVDVRRLQERLVAQGVWIDRERSARAAGTTTP